MDAFTVSFGDGSGFVGINSLPSHSMCPYLLLDELKRAAANALSFDNMVCLSNFALFWILRAL